MALVVEDGTGVANANSYTSVANFQLYAQQRGLTVPSVGPDCEVLLIKAMDYLELILYKGYVKTSTQPLQWPRVYSHWCSPAIPIHFSPKLSKAQCVLANLAQTIDLLPAVSPDRRGPVISESVYGAVSQTFGLPAGGVALQPYLPEVRKLLRDLIGGNDGISAAAIRA